jgi:hypothetical protein
MGVRGQRHAQSNTTYTELYNSPSNVQLNTYEKNQMRKPRKRKSYSLHSTQHTIKVYGEME